jgi:hypothetical protein
MGKKKDLYPQVADDMENMCGGYDIIDITPKELKDGNKDATKSGKK